MRDDLKLEAVDQELRLFIKYCKSLPDLYDSCMAASADYYAGGIKSLRLKSKEEGKYKRSIHPPIDQLQQLLFRKDELLEEYKLRAAFCHRIQEALTDLSDEEVEVLYWRYEKELTLRQLGAIYGYGKDQIRRKLENIQRKMSI